MQAKRYLITSALPYANGPLHIGHLAGAYLPADLYVRFLRLMGKDVLYVCGSDENGAAITMRALKEGKTTTEIIEKYHRLFVEAFEKMGISFDIYHRTSSQLHHETSQEVFRKLYAQGAFEEKSTAQYYDEKTGQFLADRYIKGTCPKCGYEEAYGDQCENCGSTLSPTELINPTSTLSGQKPKLKTTTHWYLPLDEHEQWLKKWITEGVLDDETLHDPGKWKNHVIGQCMSWLDNGLQPRAMTRDLDWGVDVPPEIEGAQGKKLYVWLDAPIGYISATKQWAKDHGKDWKTYWQDKDTALIHFIGKDNIVFHCLIFPAILKAHGDYILPKNVPANQFVNLEGKKLSTSRNWAVWVNEFVNEMPNRIDEMRYHMIKNMPEQRDSEFTWKGFQESTNNELVNNLANFTNRVIVLLNKYYDGKIPDFDIDEAFVSPSTQDYDGFHDSELVQLHDDLQDLNEHVRNYEFRAALQKLMAISAQGNQLLQFNEPWKNIKEDPDNVKVVMNLAAQYVAAIQISMAIFMPKASDRLGEIINYKGLQNEAPLDTMLTQLSEGELLLPVDHQVGKAVHLFTRISDEDIQKQIDKLAQNSKDTEHNTAPTTHNTPPIKDTIEFDDFVKMDLRVAEIIAAQKVPKADKLLQLELNLGSEKRTVVSGIAEHYKPEEVVGLKVSLVANLAPRKLRGVVSQGMILMSEGENGKLAFVNPGDALPGSEIK